MKFAVATFYPVLPQLNIKKYDEDAASGGSTATSD